jgi:hypothetical protein
MITSLVAMPAFFNKDSLGLLVEDPSNLMKIAKYNFDLGLEVGEIIHISNLGFLERNYTFEARVIRKLKILKEEVVATPDDDNKYTLTMEYVVEIVREEDLLMIRRCLRQLFLSENR